ncbi:methyltransferase [Bradyrhizobium sp. CCBAU 53415]|nr:methyltransferase [Bradyrhizobium sp. CCBAU 53415]
MASSSSAQALPPHIQLIQMGSAYWISRVVFDAAKLGLADQLSNGPKNAIELAHVTRTHAPSLHRLMRTLASLGVLTETDNQRFALTPLGEALKTDAPGSAQAAILLHGSEWHSAAFQQMLHSIETGETAMEKVSGLPLFDYLSKNPSDASLFNKMITGVHAGEPAAVAAGYDFSTCKTVVDVGGGTGSVLAAILAQHPGPRGVLFDSPHVVAEAPPLLKAKAVTERVAIESGNFFHAVPSGGDCYILSHILHDWNDEQCVTILDNCRRAMKPGGRLLIIEMVLPPGDTPHPGKILDMVMLVVVGGVERTEAEYAALLSKSGFRLNSTVPTNSAVSIVEAVLS